MIYNTIEICLQEIKRIGFKRALKYCDDVVAYGGKVSVENFIESYKNGIFLWSSDPEDLYWFSPIYRAVLGNYIIPREIKKYLKDGNEYGLKFKFNENFELTVRNCASRRINQPHDNDEAEEIHTWLYEDYQTQIIEIHKMGFAKSFEIWEGKEMIGGLYGIHLGQLFIGESMFFKKSNMSKLAHHYLMEYVLKANILIVDSQVINDYTLSLGYIEIERNEYFNKLKGINLDTFPQSNS